MRIAPSPNGYGCAKIRPVGPWPFGAIGITLIQVGWVIRLLVGWSRSAISRPSSRAGSPCRRGRNVPTETPWHAGHIVERYGLFNDHRPR
jgi:hypothetical protein